MRNHSACAVPVVGSWVKERDSPSLSSLAWWGFCLHRPAGLLGVFMPHLVCSGLARQVLATTPWCCFVQIHLSPPLDLTDHSRCWYNTTILSKHDDTALGKQPSHRQGMGKGCMENWNTGKKHLELPSGLGAEPPQQLLCL